MRRCSLNTVFNNQNGAALLYILFVVVIFSIIGSVMLMNTTYGMESVVKNEKEQQEFYLAEGALEVFINELNTQDTYMYLENNDGKSVTYKIKERDIQVSIDKLEKESTPGMNVSNIIANYDPSYAESLISRVVRVVAFPRSNVSNVPVITGVGNDKTYLAANKITEIDIHTKLLNYLNPENELEINGFGYTVNRTYQDKKLTLNNNFTVPAGTIQIVDSLEENGNVTINLNGILVVRQYNKNGNKGYLNLNGGGLITKGICESNAVRGKCPDGDFKGKGNGNWKIVENEKSGVPCGLLQSAGINTKELNLVCSSAGGMTNPVTIKSIETQ